MDCNTIINDNDIGQIYIINGINRKDLFSECESDNIKKTTINIYDNSSNKMNLAPIERKYHKVLGLRSFTGDGKVAEHKLFVLYDNFRGHGIAKKLHRNEMHIYANNDFVEIQLDAAWDGVLVWKKLGFEYYKKQDENALYAVWTNYFLNDYTGLSFNDKLSIISKYMTMSSVPKKYTNDFGRWLHNNNHNFVVPMYKRLG